jgi:hypothetical protein
MNIDAFRSQVTTDSRTAEEMVERAILAGPRTLRHPPAGHASTGRDADLLSSMISVTDDAHYPGRVTESHRDFS